MTGNSNTKQNSSLFGRVSVSVRVRVRGRENKSERKSASESESEGESEIDTNEAFACGNVNALESQLMTNFS